MEPNTSKRGLIKWVVGVAVIVLIVIVVVTNRSPKETGPIKIGVITPLTGDAAVYGEALKKGLDLALDEVNKGGGVIDRQIELLYEDSHLDSKTAISAFNKFIDVDKVNIVILGEGSGATSAVVPQADKTNTVVMIPIASADSLKEAGDYVFRIMPGDSYRGEKMGSFAKSLGFQKASILYVNDDYGVGIKNIFSDSFIGEGGQIITQESFKSGDTDFKSQLTKIKQGNPDVVIVAARKEFSSILRQKDTLGLTSKILATEVLDESILGMAGNSSEGVLALDFAPTTDYVNFKDNFLTKYGIQPPLFSDYGYDSLKIIVQAIKEAKSVNNNSIKKVLYGITYKGAGGEIRFDKNGEVSAKALIPIIVEGGKFVPSK